MEKSPFRKGMTNNFKSLENSLLPVFILLIKKSKLETKNSILIMININIDFIT